MKRGERNLEINIYKIFLVISVLFVLSLSFTSASTKMAIEFLEEGYEMGESISFRISLLDESNHPLQGEVKVILEDSSRRKKMETTARAGEIKIVDLGEGAHAGQGKLKAFYEGQEKEAYFIINPKELAEFKIEGENLIIKNVGNTRYNRIVQIMVGETVGTKEPSLSVGESNSYKLVAPAGSYSIKVTDGQTTLTTSNVRLTGIGTGRVVGAIDEDALRRNPFTGVVNLDEDSVGDIVGYMRRSPLAYIFILVLLATTILLAVERRYYRSNKNQK